MTNKNKKTSYLTIKQTADRYPFLGESGWRWLIYKNKKFCKKCVRRIGRRILLKEEKILEFIEESENE